METSLHVQCLRPFTHTHLWGIQYYITPSVTERVMHWIGQGQKVHCMRNVRFINILNDTSLDAPVGEKFMHAQFIRSLV